MWFLVATNKVYLFPLPMGYIPFQINLTWEVFYSWDNAFFVILFSNRPRNTISLNSKLFHWNLTQKTSCSTQWRTQKIFMGRVSFNRTWCHFYLVCVVCDIIIWRHIHVFQTNVLAKFALISHSRQSTVYGKKSFLSKESDTKILQSIYVNCDVGIISSYSNKIADKIKTLVLDKVNYRGTQSA